MNLTKHDDIPVSCHVAEGVPQHHSILSRIVSVWPEDHEALLPHRVVRVVFVDLQAIVEPPLLLHHPVQHAVLQGEPLASLYSQRRLRAQDHILELF